MGCNCSPECKYWVWLYYRSEEDNAALCEHPDRKRLHQEMGCKPPIPRRHGYCDAGVGMGEVTYSGLIRGVSLSENMTLSSENIRVRDLLKKEKMRQR